jgi:transposase
LLIIEGSREKQILDKMLSRFGELGLLKSRGKARTDSTHVLAAVKELTRLEHLEETHISHFKKMANQHLAIA